MQAGSQSLRPVSNVRGSALAYLDLSLRPQLQAPPAADNLPCSVACAGSKKKEPRQPHPRQWRRASPRGSRLQGPVMGAARSVGQPVVVAFQHRRHAAHHVVTAGNLQVNQSLELRF